MGTLCPLYAPLAALQAKNNWESQEGQITPLHSFLGSECVGGEDLSSEREGGQNIKKESL